MLLYNNLMILAQTSVVDSSSGKNWWDAVIEILTQIYEFIRDLALGVVDLFRYMNYSLGLADEIIYKLPSFLIDACFIFLSIAIIKFIADR